MVLTTRGDEMSRDAAMEAGASGYMTKPFSPPALAATVEGSQDFVDGTAAAPPGSDTKFEPGLDRLSRARVRQRLENHPLA